MREDILRKKFIADLDEPVMLFIVGGHLNKMWAVHQWFWVPFTFMKMIYDLHRSAKEQNGFIDGHMLWRFFPLGITFVSYWRSFEDLERYARSQDEPHLQVWQRYARTVAKNGSVAIWHEMYRVEPGQYEAVYGNSVPYGLARVANVETAAGRKHNARGRFNPDDESVSEEPLVPMPEELYES